MAKKFIFKNKRIEDFLLTAKIDQTFTIRDGRTHKIKAEYKRIK